MRVITKRINRNRHYEITGLYKNKHCFNMKIANGDAHILTITKQNKMSGTQIMRQIRKLAQDYPSLNIRRFIIDHDVSWLKIQKTSISLSVLSILTTGQSWYNKIGYHEHGFESNFEIATKYISSCIRYRPRIKLPFAFNKHTTIQQFFQEIQKQLASPSITVEELAYYHKLLCAQKNKLMNMFRPNYKFGDLICNVL